MFSLRYDPGFNQCKAKRNLKPTFFENSDYSSPFEQTVDSRLNKIMINSRGARPRDGNPGIGVGKFMPGTFDLIRAEASRRSVKAGVD